MEYIDSSKEMIAKIIEVVGLPAKENEVERQVLGAFIYRFDKKRNAANKGVGLYYFLEYQSSGCGLLW